jgi:hypothetical protein
VSETRVSDALRKLLADLPVTIPVEQIDRIWLFEPREKDGRESGLVVVARFSGGRDQGRQVITIRYETRQEKTGVTRSDTITDEGTVPAERLNRLIDGVLRRIGDDAPDPITEKIEGSSEKWAGLLRTIEVPPVDPISGE